MEFRIADTFTKSLTRLNAQEQKAAKTTAFDLQLDPSAPGLSFHRVDRARDPNFWSVRVNVDIRLIVHRTGTSLLLAYVDHHDDAYRWAERRRIERHPVTGAMQLVEVRELVEEVPVAGAAATDPGSRPFARLRKPELMALGVPADWVEDVRAATEDGLFAVLEHLPQEAQEALLRLAVGEQPAPPLAKDLEDAPASETPAVAAAASPDADAFAHPDAQRRFRLMLDVEELRRALDFPWERWAVFLHPAQRGLVERRFSGPARVTGSAGTGKTIVALHRAVHLARRDPKARVLLTTVSEPLARALAARLAVLAAGEPAVAARIDVRSLAGAAEAIYAKFVGTPKVASTERVRDLLTAAAQAAPAGGTAPGFFVSEWSDVVDAQQIATWDGYRDAPRLGRKTRLGEKQRHAVWAVFEAVLRALEAEGLVTRGQMFGRLANVAAAGEDLGYDHVVVDEAQDLGVPEARFLAALAGKRPDGLFFAGDLGQRIFQQPFSWKAMGLDVRGRSHSLRINYRTSHQIRSQADRLLPGIVADVDGARESRKGTVSLFDGPVPEVALFRDAGEEAKAAGAWITARMKEGCPPEEVGVLVRSAAQHQRAVAAADAAGARAAVFDERLEPVGGSVSVCQMHLAKGLEFRAVAVLACDDDVLPLQERVEAIADEADLEEVYETERHLLYVACTRARDRLWVSGVKPGSEFLRDFGG